MTQYLFYPQTLNQFLDWDDPTIWYGGVVPDAPDADVLIGPIYQSVTGQIYDYFLSINSGESFAVNAVVLSENYFSLYGTLDVASAFSIGTAGELDMYGGTLSAATLGNSGIDIQGDGSITTTGLFTNTGSVVGSGLSMDLAGLQNTGALIAVQGNLYVNVAGPTSNLVSGTLTGGTYEAIGGSLVLGFGGDITTDSANIVLGSTYSSAAPVVETIDSVDSSGATLALQDTLQTVASNGVITVADAVFTSTQTLTIAGSLLLDNNGTLSSLSTTISSTGSVTGIGTLAGPILDNGSIIAGGALSGAGTLVLAGDVSGAGALVIYNSIVPAGPDGPSYYVPGTLDITGADSTNVSFADGGGTLVIGSPQDFSATITPAAPDFIDISTAPQITEDVVQLTGISLASVTGYAYQSTASASGVLTINEGSITQTLNFAGNFDTQSFSLSAGPQLLSTTPPSLDIYITPVPTAPTIGLPVGSTGATLSAAITNNPMPLVSGIAPAGAGVSVSFGLPDEPVTVYGQPGASVGGYSDSLFNLPIGPLQITATASNAAGTATSAQPLSLFVLPAPVDGITTANVDSLQIANLLDAGYGTQFATGTEAIQLTNGTLSVGEDTDGAYLQRLYEGLLDRAGDTQGLETNAAQLTSLGTAAIAGDFLGSAEFQALHPGVSTLSNGAFVDFVYENLLGRAPDAPGFAAYTTALQNGLSRGAVVASIAESGESKAFFAADTTNVWVPNADGGLITELYQTALDRTPDASGLAAFIKALQNGATMLQVAQGIVASPEFAADHAGQDATALVTSFYVDGLGRQPDPGGLAANLGALQGGASEAQILLGIASSAEAGNHLLPIV